MQFAVNSSALPSYRPDALYGFDQSRFNDIELMDTFGEGGNTLPPALRPKISLHFRTHAHDVGPTYGVRDYHRQIKRQNHEFLAREGDVITGTFRKRNPVRDALAVLREQANTHTYDIRVRRQKSAARDAIYIRMMQPRVEECAVFKSEVPYNDKILHLIQTEYFLASNGYELLETPLPFAFTTHALERLWDRSALDGSNFHEAVSAAMLKCHGVICIVTLAHWTHGQMPPAYIAIPWAGGFFIASARGTYTHPNDYRFGARWNERERGQLDPNDVLRNEERFELESGEAIAIVAYFGATYMHASDVSQRDRAIAAAEFDQMVSGIEFDCWNRHVEHLYRSSGEVGVNFPALLDPNAIIALQTRMLPRTDPPDERSYFLSSFLGSMK